MSTSRKTPEQGLEQDDPTATGPRAVSDAPISDVERAANPWPLHSDVAPARLRSTEPPTLSFVGTEELQRLATELPLEEGGDAVARAVCEVVREVLAPAAVAVVLADDGEPHVVHASDVEPAHVSSAASDAPPRRLFPTLVDEWIVPLGRGSSFHLADASPLNTPRDIARSRAMRDLAERAALLLGAGLEAARRLARVRIDTTHLRALQTRVIQSEKLASVGQIAAKVVHELNNPLTAIVTYSAFLTKKLERAGHDEADIERLRRIGESADRILRFSRELMTYARPNEEPHGLVPIHEVVDRAVLFCEHVVAERSIELVTRLDPAAPPIVARRGQLTQVFVNLVTNACHAIQDASRDQGRIEIVAEPTEEGGVRVAVSDNGKGISPENVVRIFDPFFTTKAEGRGTGLGLSIVRSIVEDHGGRVWVRSVVGSGSSFVVELRRSPKDS